MSDKNEAEVVLEMYQSVLQSQTKQKRLKSSTFWKLFKIKSRKKPIIEKISHLVNEQGLNVKVKSGTPFGEEDKDDWIILTKKILPEPEKPFTESSPIVYPEDSWFEMITTRIFETEREVETYFIVPLLEKLGYNYDDICIGFTLEMFRGVQKTKAEADVVLFNGEGRDKIDVLLIVEAKNSNKGINIDHIGQARSYAQELLPSNYIISNGEQIIVFQFNGSLIPDEKIMDFTRTELKENWSEFYSCVNKNATFQRKTWMIDRISEKVKS
ncbi:MAG: type I restriction enzyme HsdR N-terminal domain-containing protein [Thiomicrorhabdus sp.]|jgi:hypothetical protein|nr:type I restriction enzyme HsdR N-terminal domain-containing protein [Thiomicrorhabdus sp.]